MILSAGMSTMFVTVGSTSFDALVSAVCSEDVLQLVASNGFRRVLLQIGRGEVTPSPLMRGEGEGKATANTDPPITVEWYRYKDSISDDIESASLVVGHAGAGTVLESLTSHVPLVAVLNQGLMDCHQGELASQMEEEGALVACKSPSGLGDALQRYFSSSKRLTEYVSEPSMFPAFLEDFMGVC